MATDARVENMCREMCESVTLDISYTLSAGLGYGGAQLVGTDQRRDTVISIKQRFIGHDIITRT
jgi:hypothetical protein